MGKRLLLVIVAVVLLTEASGVLARTRGFRTPRLLWKCRVGRCDSRPLVVDGATFVGGGSSLFRINATGQLDWQRVTGNQQSSAVTDGRLVFIGSDRGFLYAVRPKTGTLAWQFKTGNCITTTPAVGDGRVYAESSDGWVYALDAATGRLHWKFRRPDGSLGYSSPVRAAGHVFVGGQATLHCLDAATGREAWSGQVGGQTLSTPTVGDGVVAVGSDQGRIVGFDAATGTKLWEYAGTVKADWFGPALYARGLFYVSTYKQQVYALEPRTGKARWTSRLRGTGALHMPAWHSEQDAVYLTSMTFQKNPTLFALDGTTGELLWRSHAGNGGKGPVVSGHRLYVGDLDGYLYCYSL